MNILMALSQLEITGAEVYATTIADELIERGNKVYIVSDTLTTPTKAEYIKLEFNKRSLLKRIEHIKFLCKFIKKGIKAEKVVELAKKIMSTGIDLSITLLAGLLGKYQDNKMHAINTAKIITDISPKYASILNLRLYEGTELYNLMQEGKYDYMEGIEVLKEMKLILSSIDASKITRPIIFRANHASNYLNLKGNLPEDIPRMIKEIDYAIENEAINVNNYRFL